MLQKCRLCLKNSKNVKYIFDSDNDKATSYAVMINSIANVKVSKSDGMTNQICLSCRRKTKEFWDFKLQVERSYTALQENCALKRVCFSNIYDIELKKEVIEEDLKKEIPAGFTEYFANNKNESFNYNDTIIKKVLSDGKKPLSVIDFLNYIKEDNEHGYQDDDTYEVETDYDLELAHDPDYNVQMLSKKKKKMSKKNKENNQYETVLQNPIQPVFLEDYSVKPITIQYETVLQNPIKPVFLEDYSVVPIRNPQKNPLKRKLKDKLLICPYCGKMPKSLKIHLLSHSDEKPFKCDKCSSAFVMMKSLLKHLNEAHGNKVIKCDQCVAVFTTVHRLNSHMKSRHSTEKKHVCEVCNKAFKMRGHLFRHSQSMHNFGPKPFRCELCPDTFRTTYGLKHHMRVHTRERPYNCEICSQPYSYKHDFNRHCLKKHGVCFKRRTVNVMNEEVLAQERVLMRDLMLKVNGILKDDKPINPFEGPQAAMAFEQMMKAIQSGKTVVDMQF